jgi:tetratricopeptide (TPR) repeat protein
VTGSDVTSDKLIETCSALIDAPATSTADRAMALTTRAETFRQLGNIDRALEDDSAAVRLNPNSAPLFVHRAALYVSKGDDAAAIRDYDAALRLSPNLATVHTDRAALLRKGGDRVRALADYDAALRIDPQLDAAVTGRKSLALEIERIGAHMPLSPPAAKDVPSPR